MPRDNARRYNLSVCNIRSYGVGLCSQQRNCSILDKFTIEKYVNLTSPTGYTVSYGYGEYGYFEEFIPIGGENLSGFIDFTYPQITQEELSLLDKPDFDERVSDYLKYLNIEKNSLNDSLIENSSFYHPDGGIWCTLNPEFIVYKFLDGVRLINAGDANGEIQYKAYPLGDDPESVSWQTNPTFLTLNLNLIYIFEVRDLLEGEEFCKVSKVVSLPTLTPSTTELPEEILVYIDQVAAGCYTTTEYKCGVITASPTLSVGQAVGVDYELFAEASGDGISCADLCCLKSGQSSATKFASATSAGASPVSGSFTLCAGDIVCYTIMTVTPYCGDCACSSINLSNVDGFGTTLPSVDVGRCFSDIDNSIERETVHIYVERLCSTTTSARGEIYFTPPIPANQYIDIDFNSVSFACVGANSSVILTCKSSSSPVFSQVLSHSNLNPQPNDNTIRINHGDRLCYTLNADATIPSACGSSQTRIINALGSNGVVPVVGGSCDCCYGSLYEPIGAGNLTDGDDLGLSGDSFTVCIPATPVTISLCSQNVSCSDTCCSTNGYINISPSLSVGQCAIINVCGFGHCEDVGIGCVVIYCKPNGSTNYTQKIKFNPQEYTCPDCSSSFTAYNGDCFCYCLVAEAPNIYSCGEACLKICSISGLGICPTINSTKCSAYVCADYCGIPYY